MFLNAEASSSRSGRRPSRQRDTSSISSASRPLRRSPSLVSPLVPLLLVLALLHLSTVSAITLYNGVTTSATTSTTTAANVTYTGLPAYDPTVLTPPAAPSPPVTSGSVAVPSNSAALAAQGLYLSIPQKGNFLGFSIELSVADVTLGKNGKQLKQQFLNYMANIQNRAGAGPIIRLGGNTQDTSTIVPEGFADGTELQKIKVSTVVTDTPVINYSPELFYTMSNISANVHVQWYFGLAFNETDVQDLSTNIPLAAEYAQRILGSNLIGLALGNEPDLYVDHGDRPSGWTLNDYMNEWGNITSLVLSDGNLLNTMPFVGPSVCCERDGFEVSDLVAAGWLSSNQDRLAAVSVQHYPTNNCQLSGTVINAQDIFGEFLNHTSAQSLTSYYSQDSNEAQAAGKSIVMLEMNSASCGGFPGLSDSFGVAMWLTDWALQLAYYNFSTALIHVGGQNVYYNPFTPPPTNMSSVYQWTTGSVYYSTLVIAETFGQSNVSRVVDLTPNSTVDGNALYHPSYAIYENDAPTRVVLFNYVNDPTGASTYYTTITIPDGSLASSVSVRYLLAPTVSEHDNITWAGQTLGYSFQSDGRLYNEQQTVTITCTDGQCVVPVYAPAIALVFLTNEALTDSNIPASATATYATTVIGTGSATLDPAVLETSNGQNGPGDVLGSSSKGSAGAAEKRAELSAMSLAFAMAMAGVLVRLM